MDVFTDLTRLSLNQMTTRQWNVREVVEGCVRHGIPSIGLWREKVAELGLRECARLIRNAGLNVSSLCRGGWFPAASAEAREARIEDNRRAIQEAAELGTQLLVLVCGPAPDRDIVAARAMVEDAIAELIPYAAQHGITLGIEPLHPMFAADRSVIVTLDEALQLSERLNSDHVGVVADAYHIWWDPTVYDTIARAQGRILSFHISDWIVPLPDVLNGRGMMGDGVIDIRRLRQAVEEIGYTGPIEVEIFNEDLWSLPGDEVLSLVCERYLAHA